jgi:spore germination protein GerM
VKKAVTLVVILLIALSSILFFDRQKDITIHLYYYNQKADSDASGNPGCTSRGVVAVKRTISESSNTLEDAINLLLKGELTTEERAQGITTEFPISNFSFLRSSYSNRVLKLTFQDIEHKSSGGSCRVSILREEIMATAKQFAGIDEVVLLPEDAFQP